MQAVGLGVVPTLVPACHTLPILLIPAIYKQRDMERGGKGRGAHFLEWGELWETALIVYYTTCRFTSTHNHDDINGQCRYVHM